MGIVGESRQRTQTQNIKTKDQDNAKSRTSNLPANVGHALDRCLSIRGLLKAVILNHRQWYLLVTHSWSVSFTPGYVALEGGLAARDSKKLMHDDGGIVGKFCCDRERAGRVGGKWARRR